MLLDNVYSRMFQRNVFVTAVLGSTMLLVCSGDQSQDMKTATACYGNTNNYLRLDCDVGYYIHVLRVIHAAKVKTAGCISPASVDTYRRDCCGIQITDCSIEVLDGSSLQCENKTNCDAVATWSNTNKECDQDDYPPNTNYMKMEYMCVKIEVKSSQPTSRKIIDVPSTSLTSTSSTTTATSITTLLIPTSTQSTSHSTTTTSKTTASVTTTSRLVVSLNISTHSASPGKTPTAAAHQHTSKADEEELSDAMIGAIVGGCLGMLLTFTIFVFYWGRKRRLRIVGKPQATVWDYLLSQTFTVRGAKGYDHFSSVRSSASSDGDPNSPVVRKNMWLPNIVEKDDRSPEDVVSIYDNDSGRFHRVEIHHNAQPSPYAILNLHVNNLHQDTNHEV